jgi:deoxyadenosine/deoxycytidine kinase
MGRTARYDRIDHVPAPVISVVGNIGAGKSTLVARLADRLQMHALPERFDDNPYLERFYAEPQRWAFISQSWFLIDALRRADLAREHRPAVMEHGPGWIGHVMTGSMIGRALVGDDQVLMEELVERLVGSRPELPPTAVIALQAPIDTLLRRISARGRRFEDALTADALEAIDERAAAYLADLRARDIRVLTVDTTEVDSRTDEGLNEIVRRYEDE